MGSSRRRVPVVLDTNFLLIPGQHGVDVLSELDRVLEVNYRLVTLKGVVEELKRIADSKEAGWRDRAAARIALKLLERVEVLDYGEGMDVDEAITRYAVENRAIVCTVDGELRKKLNKLGIPVVYLRELSHLEVEPDLWGGNV